MGKARAKAAPTSGVVVKYDLFDLPTGAHKAGLAGLILQIRYMEKTKRNYPEGAIPAIVEMTSTSATLRFTKRAVQGIFDALYEAKWTEIESRTKWSGEKPKKILEVEEENPDTKNKKKVKRFVYDVVHPSGSFLRDHYPNKMDETKDWHKLWREMLWEIPRGRPTTRIPFKQRADGKHCKEGQDAWKDLVKVEKASQKNAFYTGEVASSLWLGAQAVNAEAIPFVGRAEQNLLLHFWPLTVLIFQPQQITREGKNEFVGYTLAIPEVSDLESFVEDYPAMLHELGTEVRGYRPADAVIDLPAQGALAFLDHLARLTAHVAEHGETRASISSVEYIHLNKTGNNVKSLAAGRVAYRQELVRGYRAIVGEPGKAPPYRNPLFRRGLLLALLDPAEPEWYEPLSSMLVEMPWPFFVRSEKSPRTMPWFWQDAVVQFDQLLEFHQSDLRRFRDMAKDNPAKAAERPKTPLPLLIHRLVESYVNRKTEDKSGLKWESFKDKKVKDERTGKERVDVPPAYREAREKVASGTFLEMRSRREQAFVDHFTATFCSVKQFLSEDDFQLVAEALLNQHENVKTLTLLALSANS
jgi:CRISPR-associated protein Cmx8